MKQIIHAFVMCQSMFCSLPAPSVWDESARKYMLVFLPVVGLEIGAIWVGIGWLCALLRIPSMITALILSMYPFVVTGYIHLDGFLDVTDAIKSCRELDKRRAILKDPHVGSFAVIDCVFLMLAQFALFASMEVYSGVLFFLPAVSRCCSALGITLLKPMGTSQYANQQKNAAHIYILTGMLFGVLILGFFCFGYSAAALLVCILGCILSIGKGYRSLGGMNGDISGYALTIGELWGIAALAVMGGYV